jgi:hypothetical protein
LAVACDPDCGQVFECAAQLERSRCALEEIDGFAEVLDARLEQTADVGGGRCERGDAGVQLRPPLTTGKREPRELVISRGKGDAREQHFVGGVEREPGRAAIVSASP